MAPQLCAARPRPAPAPGPADPSPRRPGRRRRAAAGVWPYLLVAPTVLGAAFLLAYPLLRNLLISVQHFGMAELIRGGAPFAGLANYRELLGDGEFWRVLARTLVWTGVNVVLIMGIGTLVALMLQRLGRVLRLLVLSALALAWATPPTWRPPPSSSGSSPPGSGWSTGR